MDLQTILQAISFWKIENYADELNINFASEDEEVKKSFGCDFTITFLFQNKYFCYCIVQNPQSDENVNVIVLTVYGHFLYRGKLFFEGIKTVAQFYERASKLKDVN